MAGPRQVGPVRPTRRTTPASGPASAPANGPVLAGLTFFNPREVSDAPALTEALRAQGAAVIERPMIQFVPPSTWAPFDKRLASLSAQDWVAFTSATAVRFTLQRMRALKRASADLSIARL